MFVAISLRNLSLECLAVKAEAFRGSFQCFWFACWSVCEYRAEPSAAEPSRARFSTRKWKERHLFSFSRLSFAIFFISLNALDVAIFHWKFASFPQICIYWRFSCPCTNMHLTQAFFFSFLVYWVCFYENISPWSIYLIFFSFLFFSCFA